MTDVVNLVREIAEVSRGATQRICNEAATEIERLREVVRQGVAMRAAQKAYFADRSRENLIASKEAEKAFDAAARAALGEDK
jgi:hypothetical protein